LSPLHSLLLHVPQGIQTDPHTYTTTSHPPTLLPLTHPIKTTILDPNAPSTPLSHLTPMSHSTPNRYYGIAIVNSQGKKLKMPRGAVTVTYQIHRSTSLCDYYFLCSQSFSTLLSSFSSLPTSPLTLPSHYTFIPPLIRPSPLYPPPLCREGLSPPLAYTPLSEAWSDNLFYFSTLSFKRSGNYTVSFLLEVI
jgi:hypothetical protein